MPSLVIIPSLMVARLRSRKLRPSVCTFCAANHQDLMRRLSFLLCLALLVSQLGFPVASMAAAWANAGAASVTHAGASESSVSGRIGCDVTDNATCGAVLHCDACQQCHGCHAPGLPIGAFTRFLAASAQPTPSTSAIGHLSADSPPDLKPPIR